MLRNAEMTGGIRRTMVSFQIEIGHLLRMRDRVACVLRRTAGDCLASETGFAKRVQRKRCA
jgi:hypothetical protein